MNEIRDDIADLQQRQNSIKFAELAKICVRWFGPPRINGSSHHVYRMPGQAIRASISNAATTAQPRHIRLSRSSPHWPEWRKNMEKHEHYTYRITGQRKNVNMSGCAPNSPRCPAGRHAYRRIGGYRESGERNDRRYADARRNAPQALAEKNFSGKLVLRMTPEQHRRLAIGAMEEGVSLNRYLCARGG